LLARIFKLFFLFFNLKPLCGKGGRMKKMFFSSFIMAMSIAMLALCANAIAGTMIATAGNDENTQHQDQVAMVAPDDSVTRNAIINQEVGAVTETRCLVVATTKSLPLPVARSPDGVSGFVGASDLETTLSCLAAPTARSPDANTCTGNNGMRLANIPA
jgi:hypothetical protein